MDEKRYFSSDEFHMVVLESDTLRVSLIPEIGFKITSIYVKDKGFELLTRPVGYRENKMDEPTIKEDYKTLYKMPYPGAPFNDYDISGINDCIPTITACEVAGIGHFNDHGDAWSRPWNVFEEDIESGSIKAYFRLSTIPLYFERHVNLTGSSLLLEYRLLNESVAERPWMWALNNLCHFDKDARLLLPAYMTNEDSDISSESSDSDIYFDNMTEKAIDIDPAYMSNIEDGKAYKLYGQKAVKEGRASIIYPNEGVKYSINWDPELFPYLGIWINRGGSPGKESISLQPTNGFYDRLDRAIRNNKVGLIGAREEISWTISLDLEDIN